MEYERWHVWGWAMGKAKRVELRRQRSLIVFSFALDELGACGTVQWVLAFRTKRGKE